METISFMSPTERQRLHKRALVLAVITILYNLAEGAVSVYFGLEDETMALFGFGLDSFVEVVSGIGILHMLLRNQGAGSAMPDHFEARALKITGFAFYVLAAGLVATSALNLIQGHAPETTFWGIVISAVSIISMGALIVAKVKVGRALNSDAILADANCTKTCLYLSVLLMVSSVGYELTGFGGLDAMGALGIAWFAFSEGREAFEKAKGKACSCAEGTCKPDC